MRESSHRRDTESTERAQSRGWFSLRPRRVRSTSSAICVLCVSAVNLIALPYTHSNILISVARLIYQASARYGLRGFLNAERLELVCAKHSPFRHIPVNHIANYRDQRRS